MREDIETVEDLKEQINELRLDSLELMKETDARLATLEKDSKSFFYRMQTMEDNICSINRNNELQMDINVDIDSRLCRLEKQSQQNWFSRLKRFVKGIGL